MTSTLLSIIKKESLHIVRDTRTMLSTIAMPLVLLVLFGFAISTEVSGIRVTAVVSQFDDTTRAIVQRLRVNQSTRFLGITDHAGAIEALQGGNADAAVVLITDPDGTLRTQIIVNASIPTTSQASAGYLQNIIAGSASSAPVIITTLYNPQLRSAYNFVPGIMGMIFILICAIMTSVSIVSEKESGSMNLLLISPARPATIIIGKLIPYILLSCVLLAVMLLISYTLLGLPVSASLSAVIMLSLIYIILSVSIGLLVSTIVDTQLNALIVSAVLFMLPIIMFSGMIFPIDNMPQPLQWFSCIIPARWYTAAMRRLMIQQLSFADIRQEMIILCGMTIAILTIAIKKFSTKA